MTSTTRKDADDRGGLEPVRAVASPKSSRADAGGRRAQQGNDSSTAVAGCTSLGRQA